jgi:hypothetical protein
VFTTDVIFPFEHVAIRIWDVFRSDRGMANVVRDDERRIKRTEIYGNDAFVKPGDRIDNVCTSIPLARLGLVSLGIDDNVLIDAILVHLRIQFDLLTLCVQSEH